MSVWAHIDKMTTKSEKEIKLVDCKDYQFILRRRGVLIDMSFAHSEIKDIILRHFTLYIDTLMGYKKKVVCYKSNYEISQFIAPRFGMMQLLKERFTNYTIVNKIGRGFKPSTPYNWSGSFTGNQPVIADYIMKNHFSKESAQAGSSGLILNLEAGQGKTFLATGLIEKIQRKTLIVCHNRSIMHQWVKVLKQAYPENTIAHFYGEKKETGDIMVGVINSLVLQEPEFFTQFGYTILDEVHEYAPKTRRTIYSLSSSYYILGLSATPQERSDPLDTINIWNCGEILDATTIDGYSMDDIPFKGEVTAIKYVGSEEYTKIITNKTLDVVSYSEMVSQLCNDPARIHLIVKSIHELRQKNMNVLVFADRRQYLEDIRIQLDRFNITTCLLDDVKINSKRLVGGASAEEVALATQNSNVILSTFQFFGTGVSIPKLDSIVLTTPRKTKSKQYIGRIFRLGSDYSTVRQIIDIVDWATPMKAQFYKRRDYYNTMGYPIKTKKVTYVELDKELEELNTGDDYVKNTLDELENILGKNIVL